MPQVLSDIYPFTLATGPTGHTGLTGAPSVETGPTGWTGFTGPTGETGLQGVQGTEGLTGHTGFTGPTGETGPQGVQGTEGLTGHTGFTGPTGETGPVGAPSVETGPTGYTGYTGFTGVTGPTGTTGASGDLYATTSSTSMSIPTTTGVLRSFTAASGLAYTIGQVALVVSVANSANRFKGDITSYDKNTGGMVINITDYAGTGTTANWAVNLEGAPGPQGSQGVKGDTGWTGWTGWTGSTGTTGALSTNASIRVVQSTSQTIPNAAQTIFLFDTSADFNTDANVFTLERNSSATKSKIKISQNGKYLINVKASVDNYTYNDFYRLEVLTNETTVDTSENVHDYLTAIRTAGNNDLADTVMMNGTCLLNVTSQPRWVSVAVYRDNAPGNGSTVVGTGYKPFLEIVKLS